MGFRSGLCRKGSGQLFEVFDIDRTAICPHGRQLGYNFAPPQNSDSLSRLHSCDEFAQMRLGIGKIDIVDHAFLTI